MTNWTISASILGSVALKSTVVLGAAWLSALLLRRRSPAVRHLIWTAASAAVLAIPFLSAGLPALRVPSPAAYLQGETGLVFRGLFGARGRGRAGSARPAGAGPAIACARPAFGRPGTVDSQDLACWCWALAGTDDGRVCVPLAVATARLPAERRRHGEAACGRTGDSAFRTRAGRRRGTDADGLRSSAAGHSDALRSGGVDRGAAARGPASRTGHVRRGDGGSHLIARLALSLHWWNPLAWIAWREFLKERERAAARPGDRLRGASVRLRRAPARGGAVDAICSSAAAAVAMARRSDLEGRLLSISTRGSGERACAARLP